jgi:hypothetical protein
MDELETRVVGVRRRLHLAGRTALASAAHPASTSKWPALSRPACTDGHHRQLRAAGRGDRGDRAAAALSVTGGLGPEATPLACVKPRSAARGGRPQPASVFSLADSTKDDVTVMTVDQLWVVAFHFPKPVMAMPPPRPTAPVRQPAAANRPPLGAEGHDPVVVPRR